MRRTQANQISLPLGPAPFVLASGVCCVCGNAGLTIIALGRNANGAIEAGFCSVSCAVIKGWPWIVERAA